MQIGEKPRFKVETYEDLISFRKGLQDEFEKGYQMTRFHDSGRVEYLFVVTYVSFETLVDTTLAITEAAAKSALKDI